MIIARSLGFLAPSPSSPSRRKRNSCRSRCAPLSVSSSFDDVSGVAASPSFRRFPVHVSPSLRGKALPADASRALPTTTIASPGNSWRRISRRENYDVQLARSKTMSKAAGAGPQATPSGFG